MPSRSDAMPSEANQQNSVLNDRGEMMDEPALDAKRFVRAFLFLPIIAVLLTMIKPVQAAGFVSVSRWISAYGKWNATATAIIPNYSSPEAVCLSLQPSYIPATYTFLWFEYRPGFTNEGVCHWKAPPYSDLVSNSAYLFSSACPVNSTGTTTCTCNTGFQPDAAGTRCVPANNCPVSDLPPITDPEILPFENNPDLSDTARLTPRMQTALSCLQTAAAAGSPKVGSAYRPPAYNQHLIDVWYKWRALKNDDTQACANLKSKIQQHFRRHELLESQQPVPNSRHTRGLAVDVTISLPPANIDAQARSCGLYRPLPITDRVHFQFP